MQVPMVVAALILVMIMGVTACTLAFCCSGCEYWVFYWDSNIQKRARQREDHLEQMAICRAAYEQATKARASAEKATTGVDPAAIGTATIVHA
jgi:16S rRNA C1402 (ribose-2'-O) methylase RsmI